MCSLQQACSRFQNVFPAAGLLTFSECVPCSRPAHVFRMCSLQQACTRFQNVFPVAGLHTFSECVPCSRPVYVFRICSSRLSVLQWPSHVIIFYCINKRGVCKTDRTADITLHCVVNGFLEFPSNLYYVKASSICLRLAVQAVSKARYLRGQAHGHRGAAVV
jgi:hypothetical protein